LKCELLVQKKQGIRSEPTGLDVLSDIVKKQVVRSVARRVVTMGQPMGRARRKRDRAAIEQHAKQAGL
jgi:hypothetical protein